MGKILIAEDSLIVNQHIRRALEASNHNVLSAFSGKEAVSIATEQSPSLILMDIMMESSSDGIDAAIEIKNTLDIPIIFLTALTDEHTLRKVKISQPYGYIIKPFNEVELLSNIEVALSRADAELAIKKNSELFQAIISSIDQAIMMINNKKLIKYANPELERILNMPFKNLHNKNVDDLIKVKVGDIHLPLTTVLKKPSLTEEFEIKGSDLILGDCDVVKEVYLKEKYQFIFLKDISERVKHRRMEEELKTRRIAILIEGQENERERIARDLHDGVGQLANVIKMTARKLESAPELNDSIDLFLDELRKTTEGLLPLRLKDFSLEVSLNNLIRQINNSSSINFSFSSYDVIPVPMNVKINVYRVVQEALNNILKHSNAKNAFIQLNRLEDHLQLTIEDDGEGFNMNRQNDDQTSHYGLQNIFFRSEVMGAECDIESSCGKGTFISLKIPISK